MHTVMRVYTGHPGFADELKKRGSDLEADISSVRGFIAYYLIRTSDGATSITVCEDRKGCDESSRRASEWLRKNMPHVKLEPPQAIAGELVLKFANYPAKV